MITSRNTMAARVAVAVQPSLTSAKARPADLVSLNPQPLPPDPPPDVLGRRVDSFSTGGELVSLNPQPLPPKEKLASVRDLTASFDPFKATRSFRDSFAKVKATLIDPASLGAALKVIQQVDQLTKAEKLMEQAYKTYCNPSSNQVDWLRADDLRRQAGTIRNSVAPGLSQLQQKALEVISNNQQDAMETAKWGIFDRSYANTPGDQFDQKGLLELEKANQKFQLGAQENTSLINWLETE